MNGALARREQFELTLVRFGSERLLFRLARAFAFDGRVLSDAIKATFRRRGTVISAELPLALTSAFYSEAARATQWRRFVERQDLEQAPSDFAVVGDVVRGFLEPVWAGIAAAQGFARRWDAGAREAGGCGDVTEGS